MTDLTADPAASTLVAKVWNLAHVLNGAGVGSGEYTEQVTYLLFLKLDAERVEEEGLDHLLPESCRWSDLAPSPVPSWPAPTPPFSTGSAASPA